MKVRQLMQMLNEMDPNNDIFVQEVNSKGRFLYKTRVFLSGFLQKGRSAPWLTRNPGIATFRNRTKSFNACIVEAPYTIIEVHRIPHWTYINIVREHADAPIGA